MGGHMPLYEDKPLEEIIENMRNLGETLIPQNYPKSPPPPIGVEDELLLFKKKTIILDGYNIDVHYQKSDFDDFLTETLQIYSIYSPFLPFNLVCKLAQKFLGSHHLSLVEIFREERKIYCWTVYLDRTGKPIEMPHDIKVENCSFEGFKYSYMQPSQVYVF